MQIAHVGIIMADDNELLFVPIAEGVAECQQIVCASTGMEIRHGLGDRLRVLAQCALVTQ